MKTSRYLTPLLAVLLAVAAALPLAAAGVPFTLSVRPAAKQPAPALQSFAFAQKDGLWLIVGGRTNGFHRTSTSESTFPSEFENRYFYVIDPVGDREWKVAVPEAFQEFLSATNTEFFQAGDQLAVVGGYGSNCSNDAPDCYLTYPRITLLNVPQLINAITTGQTGNISQYIFSLEDERMRVTGGGLSYLGTDYYLVFGQNYNNIYKGAYTGIYTEEIRSFKLITVGGNPTIADYRTYTDPSGATGPDSQYHRRDLNVVESFSGSGTPGITVYGGVFTKDGGGWRNPIDIKPSGNYATVNLDTSFAQKMSQYECAHLLMFDPATSTMYTSLFGGISFYYYNAQGQLEESNLDNWLPFINSITTLARGADGATTEVVQPPAASLPALLGSNAIFTPVPGLAHFRGSHDVLDYSQLPPGNSILVGWIYGGIRATEPQSSQFNPTFANNMIYEVYLERTP